MPLNEIEFYEEAAKLTVAVEPLAPPAARIGILIFLSRIKKTLSLIKFRDSKSLFKKLLKSVTLNKDVIDKLGFVGAG